jgi:hypothetical protein
VRCHGLGILEAAHQAYELQRQQEREQQNGAGRCNDTGRNGSFFWSCASLRRGGSQPKPLLSATLSPARENARADLQEEQLEKAVTPLIRVLRLEERAL